MPKISTDLNKIMFTTVGSNEFKGSNYSIYSPKRDLCVDFMYVMILIAR